MDVDLVTDALEGEPDSRSQKVTLGFVFGRTVRVGKGSPGAGSREVEFDYMPLRTSVTTSHCPEAPQTSSETDVYKPLVPQSQQESTD